MDSITLMKLGIAAVLGFLLGIEREVKRKPVGMKTTVVICLGACLITVVSIESSYIYAVKYLRQMDPLRLAAQIVSGVGFLGAGVILRRPNDAISGLTTAAIIWNAAGIGIAVGAGFYMEALIVVILIIIFVELIPIFITRVGPQGLKMKQLRIKIRLEDEADLTQLLKDIKGLKIRVKNVRIKDLENGHRSMNLDAMVEREKYTTDVYQDVKSVKGVVSAEIEGA
ncbi:MgtC/SapB transporter [Priestia megaterium]|nr:MgtC/SapB transporter [Priestia megaterium]